MLKLHNWAQLSAIQIGGVICMPVLMIGQSLNQHFGFSSAIIAVVLGNAILFLLGLVAAKMSVDNRKTTMENAIEYFGEEGVMLFSSAMALSLVAWFAIQLNMMTLGVMDLFSLNQAGGSVSRLLNIGLGVVITAVALYGVRGISLLANVSLPLLVATLIYAVFTIENPPALSFSVEALSLSLPAVSLIIAQAIACIIDLPTYYRHAKSLKHAYVSIIIVFGLCLPFLEVVGVYLAGSSGDGSFLDIFKRSNSATWNLWIASFLILAGWTTNNVNLYSGVMCLETIFKNSSEYLLVIAFGVASTSLSCINLLDHLHLVLEMIGLFIGSMGGVIFARYLLALRKGWELLTKEHQAHLVAWVIGIAVGILSWLGITATGISVLDATLGAALGTFLVLIKRVRYETTYS